MIVIYTGAMEGDLCWNRCVGDRTHESEDGFNVSG